METESNADAVAEAEEEGAMESDPSEGRSSANESAAQPAPAEKGEKAEKATKKHKFLQREHSHDGQNFSLKLFGQKNKKKVIVDSPDKKKNSSAGTPPDSPEVIARVNPVAERGFDGGNLLDGGFSEDEDENGGLMEGGDGGDAGGLSRLQKKGDAANAGSEGDDETGFEKVCVVIQMLGTLRRNSVNAPEPVGPPCMSFQRR